MPPKTQKVYKANQPKKSVYKLTHLNKKIGKMTRKLRSSLSAKWTAYTEIRYIFDQYFKKKYKTCIYELIINFTTQTDASINKTLDDMVNNIQKCMRSKSMRKDTIIITLVFNYYDDVAKKIVGGHANLLVFRPNGINEDNSQPILEWFEPHGKCFNLYTTDPNGIKFKETIELFNKKLEETFEKSITLTYPYLICQDEGVQAIEGDCNTLPLNTGGYCMLWTYLFIEFILEHQGVSTQDINESFLKKYNTPEKLRTIMLTYSKVLSSKLEKYKKTNLNQIIDEIELNTGSNAKAVDLITTVKSKMLTKKNKVAFRLYTY